jgi:hypothetical protein
MKFNLYPHHYVQYPWLCGKEFLEETGEGMNNIWMEVS